MRLDLNHVCTADDCCAREERQARLRSAAEANADQVQLISARHDAAVIQEIMLSSVGTPRELLAMVGLGWEASEKGHVWSRKSLNGFVNLVSIYQYRKALRGVNWALYGYVPGKNHFFKLEFAKTRPRLIVAESEQEVMAVADAGLRALGIILMERTLDG